MCGIAGIIGLDRVDISSLTKMTEALSHRGPDGYGYLLYNKGERLNVFHNKSISLNSKEMFQVALGHRRLSIIDLSSDSSQPMCDVDGSISVIFNGEIYNYKELRRELEMLGHKFVTNSDTEVLLKAYKEWDKDCLNKFNGMWAFVILDKRKNCVLLSRDRFGIKPLYYKFENGSLYFASEIKGLLAADQIKTVPNEKTVFKYIFKGYVDYGDETFFNEIYQFPSASFLQLDLNQKDIKLKFEKYWSINLVQIDCSMDEAINKFRELFLDAILLHTRSDVMVGSCLSGGLDSSSIVCAADSLNRKNLLQNYSHAAFGYCSSDIEYSERYFMDQVKAVAQIDMHYIDVVDQSFVENMNEVIKSQDEPFGSASIMVQWFVFKKARENGIKVMLDGQGADEILGGYHRYFLVKAMELFAQKKLYQLFCYLIQYRKTYGKYLGIDQLLKYGKKNSTNIEFENIICDEFKNEHMLSSDTNRVNNSLNDVLKSDVECTGLPALLRHEDRNSMYHSIEARVPFLDYRLVEFAFSLPSSWKIKDIQTKYILRESMREILPDTIRYRKDKIGFKSSPGLTFDYVKKNYADLLDNSTDLEKNWFNTENLRTFFNKDDRNVDNEFKIWRIINLKKWARCFF